MFDEEKQQELRNELNQLHQLLSDVDDTDLETASAMKQVADDIH